MTAAANNDNNLDANRVKTVGGKLFENSYNQIESVSSTVENNDSPLETALYYHHNGFNVIAIPKPGEKIRAAWDEAKQKPIDEVADGKSAKGYGSWSEWQSKQQTVENVSQLFHDRPNCNIAVITGKVSKAIAFDVDGEEAKKHFDEIVKGIDDVDVKNAVRNTLQTRTGSGAGEHIVLGFNLEEFQDGEELKTTTLWIGNGKHSEIKLKGERAYIIVPPSISATGNKYEFLNKAKPIVLSKEKIYKLISAFNSANKGDDYYARDNNKRNNKIFRSLSVENIQRFVEILRDIYKEGHRDEIVFGLAGLLFKNKIALPSAKSLIKLLCHSTHDEQKTSRLEVLENTYLKGLNGDALIGSTQLLDVLTKVADDDNDSSPTD